MASCTACRIEVRHIASLGDEGAGQIGTAAAIARTATGGYLVATRVRAGELLEFDGAGAFVRVAGRPGSGPGEYSDIGGLLTDAHDTLTVVDIGARRVTVVSPALRFVRSYALPGTYAFSGLSLDSGRVVLNLSVRGEAGMQHPLHVMNSDGSIVRSLGADSVIVNSRNEPSVTFRKITLAQDGTLWSARINEFRLAEWTLSGTKVRELVREPAPFAAWASYPAVGPTQPPLPEVRGVHRDSLGMLWIIYAVADGDWQTAIEKAEGAHGALYRAPADDLYDTIIEVIDPAERTVVASLRVDQRLAGFLSDGSVYSDSEMPGPRVHIWRLNLAGR